VTSKLGAQTAKRTQLGVEILETRELMAANITTTLLNDGTLRITGSDVADKIYVLQSAGTNQYIAVGTTRGSEDVGRFTGVAQIEVFGLGGEDVIDLQGKSSTTHVRINSVIDAGNGNDTVYGGDAVDRIFGGAGDDTLNGMAGNDFLYAEKDGGNLNGGAGTDVNDTTFFRPSVGGKTYFIGDGSNLYAMSPTTGVDKFTSYAVAGFAIGGNYIFTLDTQGRLYKQLHNSNMRTELDVKSTAGVHFFIDSDDYFYRLDTATNSVIKYNSTPTKAFDVTSDGYVFMLENTGYLMKKAAINGKETLFNSSKVDSFTVWADDVYMLETKTGNNPGSLIKQGANASSRTRLDYQETNGVLYFQPGYLYSFVRATGEMHRVTKTPVSFTVNGDYLVYLERNGVLTVGNIETGKTFSRGTDQDMGGVTMYAVVKNRVIMWFEDGYLRQQNLDGSGWTFANIEGGKYRKVVRAEVHDSSLVYLENDGSLRVRDLDTDKITVFHEGVKWYTVTSDDKVLMVNEAGNLIEEGLASGASPKVTSDLTAIGSRLWQLSDKLFAEAIDAFSAERAGKVLDTYSWSRWTDAINLLSAQRAGEIIWTYNADLFVKAINHLSAERAGEVLDTYSWSNWTKAINRLSAERAGEIIWTYNWDLFTNAINHLSTSRAAEILTTYDSGRFAAAMKHLSPERAAAIRAIISPAIVVENGEVNYQVIDPKTYVTAPDGSVWALGVATITGGNHSIFHRVGGVWKVVSGRAVTLESDSKTIWAQDAAGGVSFWDGKKWAVPSVGEDLGLQYAEAAAAIYSYYSDKQEARAEAARLAKERTQQTKDIVEQVLAGVAKEFTNWRWQDCLDLMQRITDKLVQNQNTMMPGRRAELLRDLDDLTSELLSKLDNADVAVRGIRHYVDVTHLRIFVLQEMAVSDPGQINSAKTLAHTAAEHAVNTLATIKTSFDAQYGKVVYYLPDYIELDMDGSSPDWEYRDAAGVVHYGRDSVNGTGHQVRLAQVEREFLRTAEYKMVSQAVDLWRMFEKS